MTFRTHLHTLHLKQFLWKTLPVTGHDRQSSVTSNELAEFRVTAQRTAGDGSLERVGSLATRDAFLVVAQHRFALGMSRRRLVPP